MTKLENYQADGANHQAKAVLAFLQGSLYLESFKDGERKFTPNLTVSRWENCREQGYVLCMRSPDYKEQLNIAFFEHRNSDAICAIKWNECTMNAPTIETANFGDVYKDKYDTSFDAGWGEIKVMSDWIKNEYENFWQKYSVKSETSKV